MTSRFLSCCLAVLGAVLSARAESVHIRYAPEPGSHWLRSGEDRRLRDLGEVAPITENVTRQEVEVRTTQLPDGGWRVLQIPRVASLEIDGTLTSNAALDQTLGLEIEMTLDAQGRAQEVRGFRELMRRLEDKLPASQYALVMQSMSEASMAGQEKARWDSQLGHLLGVTVEVGERWYVKDVRSFDMGGAEPIEGILHFSGWTELEGKRGLKVEFEYDNQQKLVRKLGVDGLRAVDWRPQGEPIQGGNVHLHGKELRVIIPQTGQLIYRTSEQIADLQSVQGVDVSEVGILYGHFEERSIYRWRPIGAKGR